MICLLEALRAVAMGFGIGIDLVWVPRVRSIIATHGRRFTERIFTPGEISYCLKSFDPAQSFAARFAVKEAFFKALAILPPTGIAYKDIEVTDSEGIPSLNAYRRAKEILGSRKAKVSISHDGEYAIGLVVLVPEELL